MAACEFCGGDIYRRPNCATCSAECSKTLRAHKALARPPCIVCGDPIPSRRGGRARTCSNACSMARSRQHDRKAERRLNPDADTPARPEVAAAARWLMTLRLPHQRTGYVYWGA